MNSDLKEYLTSFDPPAPPPGVRAQGLAKLALQRTLRWQIACVCAAATLWMVLLGLLAAGGWQVSRALGAVGALGLVMGIFMACAAMLFFWLAGKNKVFAL